MATRSLSSALNTRLAGGLGAIATPKNIDLAQKEYEPLERRVKEQSAEEALLQSGVTAAKGEEAKAQAALEQGKLDAEVQATKEFADTQRGLVEEAKKREAKDPFPTFQPTQEDATSYGQLGSMIATLGVMLGSGGKASAKVAIGSLTGMMNGWQKGRKDLWEKEAKTFDKEMARIKSIRESITKDLEMGLKLAATDRDASRAALASAAHKAGSGSVINAMINTGRALDALNVSRSAWKVEKELIEKRMSLAERQTAIDRAEAARKQELAQKAAETKVKTEKGILKPGAEVTKNYLGSNALVSDMQDISDDLKNPKIRKMIADNRLEAFASEELGKIAAQIANEQLPRELRRFLTKVRNVKNSYYLSISGKAVTGGEAMRNYGVVPQPGDSPELISDKIEGMISGVNRSISQYQKLYGLPAIDSESIKQFKTGGPNSTFDFRTIPAVEDTAPQPDITKDQYDKLEKDQPYWYGGKLYTKE